MSAAPPPPGDPADATPASHAPAVNWRSNLAGAAGRSGAAFGLTFLLVVGAGAVSAVAAGLLIGGPPWRGLAIGGLTLLAAMIVAVPLAVQRGACRVAVEAIRRFQVPERLLHPLFERILGVGDPGTPGKIAQAAQRVPLAEAEARLRSAASSLVKDPQENGLRSALQRTAHGRIVSAIRSVTLARFRQDGADTGGVDLAKVRDELVARIDTMVADQILSKSRAAVLLGTLAVLLAPPLIAYLLTRAL